MVKSIVTALAVFGAAASASSAGSAEVVNMCNYDVHLCAVPAEGGGQTEQDKLLSPGDDWSMPYTQLSNGQGWSIKLSNDSSLEHILQYEYTWHDDGIIWFDLSCVNGDPWPQNWEITADNGCTPKQTAYMYPTDDDYGMQACGQEASVTVTLCAYKDSIGASPSTYSSAAPVSSAPAYSTSVQAPAYTSVAATTPSTSSAEAPPAYTSVAATPSTSSAEAPPAYTASASGGWGGFSNSENGFVQADKAADAAPSPSPTTMATSVLSQDSQDGVVTVWDVVTAEATQVVTVAAGYGRHRRHEHHAHQHA